MASQDPPNLLDGIDAELEVFQRESNLMGWTQWILLASIAAIIWQILESLNNFQLRVNFVLIINFLYILGDPLIALFSNRFPWNKMVQADIYIPNLLYQHERGFFAFRILVNIVALFSIFKFKSAFPALVFYPYVIFLSMLSIFGLLGIIFSFSQKLLVKDNGNCVTGLFLTALMLLWVYVLSGLGREVWASPPSLNEFKIAILSVTLFFLIIFYFERTRISPLIESLIELRRKYYFKKISVENGMKELEIIISGLHGEAFLQKKIANLVGVTDILRQKREKSQNKYKEIIKIIQEDENHSRYKEVMEKFEDYTKSWRNFLDSLSSVTEFADHVLNHQKIYKSYFMKGDNGESFIKIAETIHHQIKVEIDPENINQKIKERYQDPLEEKLATLKKNPANRDIKRAVFVSSTHQVFGTS